MQTVASPLKGRSCKILSVWNIGWSPWILPPSLPRMLEKREAGPSTCPLPQCQGDITLQPLVGGEVEFLSPRACHADEAAEPVVLREEQVRLLVESDQQEGSQVVFARHFVLVHLDTQAKEKPTWSERRRANGSCPNRPVGGALLHFCTHIPKYCFIMTS